MERENRNGVPIHKGCVKPVQMYDESAVSGHRHIRLQSHTFIIENVRAALACSAKEVQQIPDIPSIFKLHLKRVLYLKNVFESPFEAYIYLQRKYPESYLQAEMTLFTNILAT